MILAMNVDFSLNISDGKTLTYPLVLIKGTVINPTCASITINSSELAVYEKSFKYLLELKLGENLITINTNTILLNYKPRTSKFTVKPLYIICKGHDGQFQSPDNVPNDYISACKRIDTGCKVLQAILAEKLNESNFERKTFMLEKCETFKCSLTREELIKKSKEEIWAELGREILHSSIGSNDRKYVGFLSCTKYNGQLYMDHFTSHEELVGITEAYVALGGGGLAIFGTACLHTWPEDVNNVINAFKNSSKIDKAKFLDDSAYRGTYGACLSTTLGSVLHELCHTFDLGHTEEGIMGRGFDNIQNIFLRRDELQENSCLVQRKDKIVNIQHQPFIRKNDFSNDIINKPIGLDDTCFAKCSAFILGYHKWFNDFVESNKYVLSYDPNIQLVKSTLGIRVVEIRRDGDEMVVAGWCFGGKILKYNHHISDKLVHGHTLFVEDSKGNILKQLL